MPTKLWRFLPGLIAIAPVLFLGLFFFYPVINIVASSFTGGWSSISEVLSSTRAKSAIWFTFWQAALSTVVTLVVAMPCAALMARSDGRRALLFKALVTIPFVLPTVVVAGAFKEMFDRAETLPWLPNLNNTATAVIIAHSFFNFAVVARTVGAYWSALDRRLEEQARLLGSSRSQVFWRVTAPRLKPAILASGAIVFLFSFTSFGVILVLGGLGQATLETEIFRHAVVRGDMASSSILATLQIVAVLVLILVTARYERRAATQTQMVRNATIPLHKGATFGITLFTLSFLGAPLVVMIERSMRAGGSYGWRNYQAIFERIPLLPSTSARALVNSVQYAAIATLIAVILGLICATAIASAGDATSRVLNIGATLPLGVSAVTVGFGILITLDVPPIEWRTKWWIVPIAHAIVATPFVVRSLVPMLRQIHPSIREAAALLGASPPKILLQVDFPLIRRGIAVASGFAFAISLGEFGATSFLPRRTDTLTAPQAIFRLLNAPGELLRGQAMALSVLLAVTVAVAIILSEMLFAKGRCRRDNKLPVAS